MADQYWDEFESTVEEYPLTTTLGVFAAGLMLGVAVGAALGHSDRSRSRTMAESFGRRVLDALQEYAPDSVRQYLPS